MLQRILRVILIPFIPLLRILLRPLVKYYRQPAVFKFQDDTNAGAFKMLFIGNSLTFTHDMPYILLSLLKACPVQPKTEISLADGFKIYMIVQGGFTLENHWSYKVTSAAIQNDGPWDYVVLQEQSVSTTDLNYDIKKHARLYADQIKVSGAKVAWFQAWTFQDKPELYATTLPRQNNLADELGALKFPVGECWVRLRETHPEIELYADLIHPSPAGAYLAACVFYVVLTGLSPVGLPLKVDNEQDETLVELAEDQGLILQKVAEEVCLKDGR